MKCIKVVVIVNCQYCQGLTIKFGKVGSKQCYRCKSCKKTQLQAYAKHAYKSSVSLNIAVHVKESCGIRSISRFLNISSTPPAL